MEKNLPLYVDYTDKVVVITGAGGVLCSEMARAFALCHAKVALLDLHLSAAEAKAEEIRKLGGNAKGYEANVLDKESLEKAHQQIIADFGKCDILINGAGGNSPKASTTQEFYEEKVDETTISFFDLKSEGFQFVFNLNILGTLLPTQIFAVDMIGKEGCSILNISSMNAFTPLTKIPAYSSAKAGVSNFTKWLATHFAKTGIRVNAIAPGFIDTAMTQALPDDIRQEWIKKIPLRRGGTTDDIANCATFLASDMSSYISGQVIQVDGGMNM